MPRNLIRFLIKPNIGIVIFLSIQIARHYILNNLDARSNVDSSVPNATLVGSTSEQTLRRKCFIFFGTSCGGGAQRSFWTPQNFFK